MHFNILDDNNKVRRSKELVHRLTAGGKLAYMALIPNLKRKSEFQFQNCSSPFRKDKNPSFSTTSNRSTNVWGHKDFGDATVQGDIYDFVALKYGMDVKRDFPFVLEKLYEIFKIDELDKTELQRLMDWGCGTTDEVVFNLKLPAVISNYKFQRMEEEDDDDEENNYIREITLHEVGEDHLDYYQKEFLTKTGIRYDVMREYNAFFITAYVIHYGDEDSLKSDIKKKPPTHKIWICYRIDERYIKIYCPNPKKFWFAGTKPRHDTYRFGALEKFKTGNNDILILAAGEKDCLCLLL
jgi:hypothetical protein